MTCLIAVLVVTFLGSEQTGILVEEPEMTEIAESHMPMVGDEYEIEGISEHYSARIVIGAVEDQVVSGMITIWDEENGVERESVFLDSFPLSTFEGSESEVIGYEDQDVVVYGDFNFDGEGDFAIMEGRESCYFGPSFEILLGKDGGFERSEEFTRLGQEYCGLFLVNDEMETLQAHRKSGCCSEQYFTFVVEENIPQLREVWTYDSSGDDVVVTGEIWEDGEWREYTETVE